jgi:hypothetical protein
VVASSFDNDEDDDVLLGGNSININYSGEFIQAIAAVPTTVVAQPHFFLLTGRQ